jgi:hypothetical protein
MSLEQHRETASKLKAARQALMALLTLPQPKYGRLYSGTHKALAGLEKVRCALDSHLFADHVKGPGADLEDGSNPCRIYYGEW